MSDALPWLFLSLSAVALLAALGALWQSLRAAFGVASVAQARSVIESEERVSLFDEKASLLRSLRDLELDRDSDKISDADYRRLDRQLRARARDVLKMLDEDVRAYRPQAEQVVAERLAEVGVTPYRDSASPDPDEARVEPAEPAAEQEPAAGAGAQADAAEPAEPAQPEPDKVACPGCDTRNDVDAVFCKKCGTRLAEADEEAP